MYFLRTAICYNVFNIEVRPERRSAESMNKKPVYILMCMVIVIWGLDFSVAKNALATLDPMLLLFCKYIASVAMVGLIRVTKDRSPLFKIKDIWVFFICVIFGEILYFYCEYSAMSYMPVSLLSIVLAFVPVVSLIIDRVIYKRRPGRKAVVGIAVCIVGISLIIGVDWQVLSQGRILGYLLAFFSVFCWNIYNFVTASLHGRYSTYTLTLNQLICTCILLLPFALKFPPPISVFTPTLIGEILFLGLLSSGVGYLVLVRSLHVLGPTATSVFSNFLPVTTTLFGWLALGETIAPLQLVGGAIVIAAGYVVIKEIGKSQESV